MPRKHGLSQRQQGDILVAWRMHPELLVVYPLVASMFIQICLLPAISRLLEAKGVNRRTYHLDKNH